MAKGIKVNMKFVVATKNPHKLIEFKRILNPLGIEVLSQTDVATGMGIPMDIDVVEDADTFEGNARLKACAIFELTGLPTIADDSGIEVYALNGEPGIYSARYGGEQCKNDVERYELLLKNLNDESNRDAQFVCAIHLIISHEKEHTFTGICKGQIGFKPLGNDGFGYDPIFMVDGKSFAELDGELKDMISHRGIALRKLEQFLKEEELINYDN